MIVITITPATQTGTSRRRLTTVWRWDTFNLCLHYVYICSVCSGRIYFARKTAIGCNSELWTGRAVVLLPAPSTVGVKLRDAVRNTGDEVVLRINCHWLSHPQRCGIYPPHPQREECVAALLHHLVTQPPIPALNSSICGSCVANTTAVAQK